MVTGLERGHAFAHLDDDARAFVAQHRGKDAFRVVTAERERVGVAHAGVRDAHQHLALFRWRDVDLDEVARRTERFTGADLEDVVRRAGLIALRRSLNAREVYMEDFERALSESRATVTPEMERDYEQMTARLKQDAAAAQPIGFAFPGRGEGVKGS